MAFTLDSNAWTGAQFSDCDLGDKRRTKSLIKMAERVGNNPSASFSRQMVTWGDLTAAYRLFDQNDVTFEAIARPYCERPRRLASNRCLAIIDTIE